ncbi:MAG: DUF1343 domain-containing protein [Bacteroidota bacterium]|nr:DUF1343 domain-containing protein [Bacteroidota bacterium]
MSASIQTKIKLILFALFLFNCLTLCQTAKVKSGADVLFAKHLLQLIEKRVGVICHQTSVLSNGVHLVDSLLSRGVNVTALFCPEHGIRGVIPAGVEIKNQIDEKTGLQVYSLYSSTLKPTPEILKDIDIIIFDLQDVGVRFYTYSITMAYAMQAAAENGKKFIVLDRPNPINGIEMEGTILGTSLKSGVGILPIPIRHGLTVGEMAKMIVGEKWLDNITNLDLQVIPMEGWKREMYYDETHLPWIRPSPNMISVSTAIVYPGTCLIEGTNVSEGRGTSKPFEYIGAPWIDSNRLAQKLNSIKLKGVVLEPIEFIPKADSISSANIKYENLKCGGVYIKVTNRKVFKSVLTGMNIIQIIYQLYPEQFVFNSKIFDRLAGDTRIREGILANKPVQILLDIKEKKFKYFQQNRLKYLIY